MDESNLYFLILLSLSASKSGVIDFCPVHPMHFVHFTLSVYAINFEFQDRNLIENDRKYSFNFFTFQ